MRFRRLLVLVVLGLGVCATHLEAQGTSFYQQLSVASTSVGLTGATGMTFCRGMLETTPIRIAMNGSAPTATVGQPVNVGDEVLLNTANDITNFRAISTTGQAGLLSLSCGGGTNPAPSFIRPASTLASSAMTARPATITQQSTTDLRACSPKNATAAVANQVTLTITPPNGLYVYLCGLDVILANDAAGGNATTNLTYTSTNLGGWLWKISQSGTAGTTLSQQILLGPGLVIKAAAPGVAVTIVSPASNATATYSTTGYYYFAP